MILSAENIMQTGKMAASFFILIFLALGNFCFSQELECQCKVEHPQTKFCNADFAFAATVTSSEQLGDLSDSIMKYNVKILGNNVFRGERYLGRKTVSLYTPIANLCGRANLQKDTYLFTGKVIEGKLVFVQCNWIQKWDEVSPSHREFLQRGEFLKQCLPGSCKVTGVLSQLKENGMSSLWKKDDCYFNPVASSIYIEKDCETEYAICSKNTAKQCIWTSATDEYDTCFENRENLYMLKESDTAFTKISDCKSLKKYNKKMYKKCIRDVKKYKQAQEEILERDLEELRSMELADMLEDIYTPTPEAYYDRGYGAGSNTSRLLELLRQLMEERKQ